MAITTITSPTSDAIRKRISQLEERAKRHDAIARTHARKAETHKKIVLGGFFLNLYGDDLAKLPPELRPRLHAAVKRESDRAALGLPLAGAPKQE